MKLIIIPTGSGKFTITDDKERKIYSVTKKRKLIGNPITTLYDASDYALYTMVRTAAGIKPAFQIIFNDAVFMTVQCKSLYVDPCITFIGQGGEFELKGMTADNLVLRTGGEEIGTLKTERQMNNDPKYLLTVDNMRFDDFMALFAVAADKCFNGKNK